MDKEYSGESGAPSYHELALRHFNVGNMKLDGGSSSEAIGEYRAAIELWDEDARFYNNLGIAYRPVSYTHLRAHETEADLV